ncbi:relaxase MobL [Coprobacillaceae bacterium CR2/5/TPMF4]|nr:relaxase MobL [Coprobacillaceae bacterium CR2/5/TPMF4]
MDQEFKINYFKKKDEVYHELITAIGNNSFGKEIKEIKDLYNVLPKNGRLSYNSYTIKPYRNMIDKITDKILKDGKIQAYFNEYVNMLEKLERYQNALLSASGERDIANIKNTELDKLYSRIGNMILKDYKKEYKECC